MIPKRPVPKSSFKSKWMSIVTVFFFIVCWVRTFGFSNESFLLPSPGEALKWKVTEGIYTYRERLQDTTSPLHWNSIAPYVTNIQIGSFCLPWTQGQNEADAWWTHHPDWQVFNETIEGYCFQPRPKPLQREYLTQIYQHQFSGNCSNLFVTQMWSSGWSADITNLIHSLQYGILHNQVMQVTSTPWHYAAPDQAKRSNRIPSRPACPLLTMFCYFLPLTSCPVQPPDSYNRNYNYRKPPRMTPRSLQWLPDYIVRPQTWLRHRVWTFLQDQRRSAIPDSAVPCTVMHVRRGDVVHHGNSSRRYHAIAEYLTLPANKSSYHRHPHILLLTDDANGISEAQQYHYHWMHIDRPRFRADEGGWEHQLPSSDPIFEMSVLLATFELVKQCQSIVYSTSGFSNWLLHEMQKTSREIGHFNIDDAVKYELGKHNLASKTISTVHQGKSKGNVM